MIVTWWILSTCSRAGKCSCVCSTHSKIFVPEVFALYNAFVGRTCVLVEMANKCVCVWNSPFRSSSRVLIGVTKIWVGLKYNIVIGKNATNWMLIYRLLEADSKSMRSMNGSRRNSGSSLVSSSSASSNLSHLEEDTWILWGRIVNEWEEWRKKKEKLLKVRQVKMNML